MFHLLPFAAGLLAGAAAIKLIREDKAKAGLDKVQDRLRDATVSSLTAIEQSSARLRGRLAGEAGASAEAEAEAVASVVAPAVKVASKRAAPRKAAVKSATKPAAAKEGSSE